MRKWTTALLVLWIFGFAPGVGSASSVEAFSDIDSHWARGAIVSAVEKGYVRGYPDGTFKPDAQVTRAEFLAIVTRASKLEAASAYEPFDDVASTHWAVDALNKGIGMGFINPAEYGATFKPDQALTRAEMVKWLVSGLAKSDPSFVAALKDTRETILPFTEYFPGKFKEADIPYIAVARGTGLVGGFPDGSFGPDRTTTRAEVVVLLGRYLAVEGKKADGYQALNELREVGTTGTNVMTIGNAIGKFKWTKGTGGKEAPLYEIFNKDLFLSRDIGVVQLNRLIALDPAMTSVYADMFADAEMRENAKKYNLIYYISEMTTTFSRDVNTSIFQEANSFAGGSVRHKLPVIYGYTALDANNPNPMLKQGVTSRYWSTRSMDVGSYIASSTLNGGSGGFVIDKE
ncbi:S-layer homology domain-containing protein [Paenibacillus sp.]|uniref:S-layer homology domain-containing protein n=1 Tax=Paenibacillus sp. TaxID=58172 RepID=UPI002D245C69|nr:S-layer homology domain-containing protein [Paenibacillus sp.]HZG56304.1 S-layer homology domain-containing protein [Paenibacillus sp.]